jgi:hypothetical protein
VKLKFDDEVRHFSRLNEQRFGVDMGEEEEPKGV